MVEIVVAGSAGFCSGVRRAVALVERLLADGSGRRVVTLGPLVHNEDEVARLRERGVEPVDLTGSGSAIDPADRVVVRTHGVPVSLLERLEETATVVDATCPYVRACQRRAERAASQGYHVLLVADPAHPETESIASFAARGARTRRVPPGVFVVGGPVDLERLPRGSRAAVLAQTTMSPERLREVTALALGRFGEVRAFDTVCRSTIERQREAMALGRQADLVLVVGGARSANTVRLVEACERVAPRTFRVDRAEAIEGGMLEGARRVVVTSGASTPERLIAQVVARIERLTGGRRVAGQG